MFFPEQVKPQITEDRLRDIPTTAHQSFVAGSGKGVYALIPLETGFAAEMVTLASLRSRQMALTITSDFWQLQGNAKRKMLTLPAKAASRRIPQLKQKPNVRYSEP